MQIAKWIVPCLVPLPILATVFDVNSTTELRQALEDAALNGQNDTIRLAPGVYRTTDDDGGTFTFNDQEEHNLTIVGMGESMDDTVLDGNTTTQVLNFNNSRSFTLTMKNLAIVHGKTEGSKGHGGGFYVDSDNSVKINLIIRDCNISDNIASGSGGGFYVQNATVDINNTCIKNNKTNYHGGGFWAGALILKNSEITHNYANYSGGGFSVSQADIFNTKIANNSSGASGGGGFSSGLTTVRDSNITDNTTEGSGGGFNAGQSMVIHSILRNNEASDFGGGIYASYLTLVTSKVISNSAKYGAGAKVTKTSMLVDSVFIGNIAKIRSGAIEDDGKIYAINNDFIDNAKPLQGYGVFINNIFKNDGIVFENDSYLYYNYIDRKDIEGDGSYNVIKKSNIQPSSGDTLFAEDNITLIEGAPVIDKGLNPDDDKFSNLFKDDNTTYMAILKYLKTDYFGHERIANGIIDMGASEYGAKPYSPDKPEISVTIEGDRKIYHPLDVNFTIKAKYPIKEIEIDKGDGYESVETTVRSFQVTFDEAGDHIIKIKVEDEKGNMVELTKTIVVYDLTTQEAIEYGKQLCQKDPKSCGIAQNTQPSTILDNPKLTQAPKGWSLLGTNQSIDADQIFEKNPKVTVIWRYTGGQWSGAGKSETINHSLQASAIPTLQTLEEGDGFWIYVKP